jgi:hypothetical protein
MILVGNGRRSLLPRHNIRNRGALSEKLDADLAFALLRPFYVISLSPKRYSLAAIVLHGWIEKLYYVSCALENCWEHFNGEPVDTVTAFCFDGGSKPPDSRH